MLIFKKIKYAFIQFKLLQIQAENIKTYFKPYVMKTMIVVVNIINREKFSYTFLLGTN